MIIDQFTLNTPPGRGPVEVMGELPEMVEVARLFGPRRFASWRVVAFSLIDHARGRVPSVILTRNEATTLCRAAAEMVFSDVIACDFLPVHAMHDTGMLAVDPTPAVHSLTVVDTILTYAHTSPPRHEQL